MQQTSPAQSHGKDEPLPEAREVAPGIWKITLPIPFPLRTVNVHALVGNDGWALVDAGIGMPDSRAALWAGLERVGLTLDKLRTIVLTHHHPDHVGLSGELQEESEATVYMHPIDEAAIQIIWTGTMPERFQGVSQFFKHHGLPPTDFWFTQVDPEIMRNIIRVPPHEVITLVEDGEEIDLVGERYRVIWTPGHSDGHICLFRERDGVFLVADHVLPRITPNVGLYSARDRVNPLGDYLNSLEKVSNLPASIVLPGHGEPFADLARRTAEIIEHHRQRELEILALLEKGPQHAYGLAEQLFGHRWNNSEARRMAVAETLSHLEHLRYSGQVEQEHTADGLILYACGQPLQAHRGKGSSQTTGLLAYNHLLKQRYRIISQVGKGGFGAVYKAADLQFGNRQVAIKEMSQSSLSQQELIEATESFKREALLLAGLTHPNLPRIYEQFTDRGRWYLVMDFS